MCKVKSGNAVTNRQDVQNLVIGVIFRQMQEYNKEQVLNQVKYHLQGTSVNVTDSDLKQMIVENLHVLLRNNQVCCRNGIYFPKINSVNFESNK